jgi:transposase
MLVMDNVRPHLPEDVAQMCEEAEVDLIYLPLYSPDLSPIEESFNRLKQWMRRNRALSQSFKEMFEGFFHLAVKLAVISKDAKGYFRSAGISVTEED